MSASFALDLFEIFHLLSFSSWVFTASRSYWVREKWVSERDIEKSVENLNWNYFLCGKRFIIRGNYCSHKCTKKKDLSPPVKYPRERERAKNPFTNRMKKKTRLKNRLLHSHTHTHTPVRSWFYLKVSSFVMLQARMRG